MDETSNNHSRDGWSEAVAILVERGEDYPIEEFPPTQFEDEERVW